MGAIDFYKLTGEQKRTIFKTLGERNGLPAYAIEKDWWVVQTLRTIFQMEVGEQLIFKGGTSLSKAWGLIDRFSEDIDLALNREFLGFPSKDLSKTQINEKLRPKSCEYITKEFTPLLQAAFKELGIGDLSFDFENLSQGNQDPVSILVQYPALIEHPKYIQPRVKVEIGSRSIKNPYSDRTFRSIIGNLLSDKQFADNEITIPCINPERTYLEKLFLLHEEFQKPEEKIRVARLSRHLYDIYKISHSKYKNQAHNVDLITETIAHRERFNGMKGVDYESHFPPNLNPIPPDKYIAVWKADYKKMQNEMIPDDSPSFDELIVKVKEDVSEYNNLNFEEASE